MNTLNPTVEAIRKDFERFAFILDFAADPANGPRVTHLRLTHPDLDFWIDVRVREFDRRRLAIANLAEQPEIGMGDTVEAALNGAPAVIGPRRSEELRASALDELERNAEL